MNNPIETIFLVHDKHFNRYLGDQWWEDDLLEARLCSTCGEAENLLVAHGYENHGFEIISLEYHELNHVAISQQSCYN